MRFSNKVSVLLASVTLVLITMQQNGIHSLVTYSPSKGWLNDPNGLVRVEGTYHLFYQYCPDSDKPQYLSWGHATSSDLVNWQDKGVALPYNPTTLEQRFSGSAVYDRHNTSGLGTSSPPVVAIYTSYYAHNSTYPDGSPVAAGTQCQSLAFSQDKGETWQTYDANPIIRLPPHEYEEQYKNFRDPKVFWYKRQSKWVMVVVLSQLRKVLFYSSTNLIEWKYMSEFSSKNAPVDSIWECPDLYKMRLENGDENKWILSLCVQPQEAGQGSEAVCYFVGHFDGETFVEDTNKMATLKRLDYGSDFYAGSTWNNVASRRLMIGWVNDWSYATKITDKYRGGLSMVRELSLVKRDDDYRLIQKPVENIYNYVKFGSNYTKVGVEDGIEIDQSDSYSLIVTICFTGVQETSFTLVLEDELQIEEAEVHYDHKSKIVYIRKLNMDPSAIEKRVKHSAKFDAGSEFKFNLFIDNKTFTLFCNNGEIVFTELLFSNSKIRTLRLRKGSTVGVREAFTQLLEAKI